MTLCQNTETSTLLSALSCLWAPQLVRSVPTELRHKSLLDSGMAAVFKDLILKDNESFKSKNNLKKYPRRRRKRWRKPCYYYSDCNTDIYGNHNEKTPPFKEYTDFQDDYDFDFYEDKNYEYIDQDDEASEMKKNFIINHKIGYDFNDSKNDFHFEPLDYSNYDYVEVGNLNFRGSNNNERYKRRRYKPKNKIYFSRRKLRNIS